MAAAAQRSQPSNDIAALVATLASRQAQAQATAEARKLTGPERAAVLMLALGETYGGKIWSMLDDDELRELSIVMSTIGTVEASSVESLLLEFVSRMSASGALMGNYDSTERLLQQFNPLRLRNIDFTALGLVNRLQDLDLVFRVGARTPKIVRAASGTGQVPE